MVGGVGNVRRVAVRYDEWQKRNNRKTGDHQKSEHGKADLAVWVQRGASNSAGLPLRDLGGEDAQPSSYFNTY